MKKKINLILRIKWAYRKRVIYSRKKEDNFNINDKMMNMKKIIRRNYKIKEEYNKMNEDKNQLKEQNNNINKEITNLKKNIKN